MPDAWVPDAWVPDAWVPDAWVAGSARPATGAATGLRPASHCRRQPITQAIASPAPARTMVGLTANPSPIRAPAPAAASAWRTGLAGRDPFGFRSAKTTSAPTTKTIA